MKGIKFKLNGSVVSGHIIHHLGYGRYGVKYEGKIYNVSESDIVKEDQKKEIARLAEIGIQVGKDFISVPKDYEMDVDLSKFRKPIIKRMF